jgi:inosine/xanthosine triphosphate pyrophosphatase family protein
MKKLFLLTFIYLFAVLACSQSSEVSHLDDFSKEITQLKAMHKEGLYLASAAFKKFFKYNSSNELVFDDKGLVSNVLNGLKGSQFNAFDDFVSS